MWLGRIFLSGGRSPRPRVGLYAIWHVILWRKTPHCWAVQAVFPEAWRIRATTIPLNPGLITFVAYLNRDWHVVFLGDSLREILLVGVMLVYRFSMPPPTEFCALWLTAGVWFKSRHCRLHVLLWGRRSVQHLMTLITWKRRHEDKKSLWRVCTEKLVNHYLYKWQMLRSLTWCSLTHAHHVYSGIALEEDLTTGVCLRYAS